MTIQDAWQPFREALEAPLKKAREWKSKTGGKVVGHLVPDVPEEIIHAAGALPVALEGTGVQITRAQAHIPGYTCNNAMAALELGLRGDLDVLDAMVIPYLCDTTRNLFHIWDHCFPKMNNEFLRLPKRIGYPGAESYLRAEFTRFMEAMGNLTGSEVVESELTESLILYNKSRTRLREAYARHQRQPSVWTAERVQMLIGSSLRAPRADHLAWMDDLPWENNASEDSESRMSLYVRGKIWDPPGILGILDSLGFQVVRDEVVTGFRSIAQDAALNGDPINALVKRHLAATPYPGYHLKPSELVERFVERVRESNARSVLFLNPKFCEAAAFDAPDFQEGLKKAGIPSLVLETSAGGAPVGQIRIRLEAFREMIAGDLP